MILRSPWTLLDWAPKPLVNGYVVVGFRLWSFPLEPQIVISWAGDFISERFDVNIAFRGTYWEYLATPTCLAMHWNGWGGHKPWFRELKNASIQRGH